MVVKLWEGKKSRKISILQFYRHISSKIAWFLSLFTFYLFIFYTAMQWSVAKKNQLTFCALDIWLLHNFYKALSQEQIWLKYTLENIWAQTRFPYGSWGCYLEEAEKKKGWVRLGPNYPISNDWYAHKVFTNTHSYAQAIPCGKLKMN